jgi:putative acetyltransferase
LYRLPYQPVDPLIRTFFFLFLYWPFPLSCCAYLYGMHPFSIRTIQPADNQALALIIRNALTEFGANKPGTVYYDPTTDALFELFQTPGSIYYVAEDNGQLLGGAGIFPSPGLPANTCELVKMYLTPAVRGKGLGKLLIEKALQYAADSGYQQVYIETMPELQKAMKVYELFGFNYLDGPLGDTGHFGCGIWMLKSIGNGQ